MLSLIVFNLLHFPQGCWTLLTDGCGQRHFTPVWLCNGTISRLSPTAAGTQRQSGWTRPTRSTSVWQTMWYLLSCWLPRWASDCTTLCLVAVSAPHRSSCWQTGICTVFLFLCHSSPHSSQPWRSSAYRQRSTLTVLSTGSSAALTFSASSFQLMFSFQCFTDCGSPALTRCVRDAFFSPVVSRLI